MSTQTCTQHYRIDPGARFRVMHDEGIFVLQDAGEVLVVNQMGAFIIERLAAEHTLDEIIVAITERYAVDPARARADATSLLDALLEAGAIVRS